MRARVLILVIAILAVAGFVALNWSEFLRTSPLSFGGTVTEAPLGLIMLAFLSVAVVAFLMTGAMHRTQTLIESHHHLKDLTHQRDLADRAEASRFTELRQHIDTQLRELRQRDTIAASEFEKAMLESQRDLKGQIELINRTLASRLAEIDQHLDAKLDRLHGLAPVAVSAARPMPMPATTAQADAMRADVARAEAERAAARDDRIAAEAVAAAEPPAKRRFWPL